MNLAETQSNSLHFFVNGQEVVEHEPDPECSLLYYLRRKLHLTGAKHGCGEGGCGACTVMVSRQEKDGTLKHISVNACLTPVVSLHGTAVTTVEGVGSVKTKLHPLQERLAFAHGSQCGFCTPGVIMSMYSLIRTNPLPSMKDIEDNLIGNLCRCTGYRPIIDGFRSFSSEFNDCGAKNCCQKGADGCTGPVDDNSPAAITHMTSSDASKDYIFPPKLLVNKLDNSDLVVFRGPRITWYLPTKLDDLLKIKSSNPEAKIVGGNTIIGIEAKYKAKPDAVQIQTVRVTELHEFHASKNGVRIGAAMGLSDVEMKLRGLLPSLPEYKSRIIRSLLEMLQWFANKQIKNVATLGGNIMTGSAVSSIMQVLLAGGARLHLKSMNKERFIEMDDNFYIKDTKISQIKQDEVVMSVFIPYTKEREFFEVYRQARRRANDSSIVNAGMKVVFEENSTKVANLKLAFGAVARTVVMAPKTMMGLKGLHWNDGLLEKSSSLLFEDLPLELGTPGGSVHYRRTLLLSFFLKFYLKVKSQLQNLNEVIDTSHQENSPVQSFMEIPIKSNQSFAEATDPTMCPVGTPMIHTSGIKHTTGEAIYVNDIPLLEEELFGVFVTSQKASASIEKIDATEAMELEGVVRFLCHQDMDLKRNISGPFKQDEEVFASREVTTVGQIIGIIVARNEKAAKEAAKKVKITYKERKPILTIEEALKEGDDYEPREINHGNVDKGFDEADEILEGEFNLAGQEHFYMETQACIAIPKEDGDMLIYSSTQNQTLLQTMVGQALGVSSNRISVRTKRVGGGFGGKESYPARFAAIIAIAATKVGKPVRLCLDRETDFISTGKGHTFLSRWKVGFKKTGVVSSISAQLYLNAGHTSDFSEGTAEKGLFHFDNVYSIANIRVSAKPCRTNTPSATAFRGFGSPQAMFVMEEIMTRVGSALNMPQNKIREINMYPVENPVTFYGQPIYGCSIRRCWDEAVRKSDFQNRLEEVNRFNREHSYHKKGIAISPVKHGIGYCLRAMSQAGALIHIYRDGSVLLNHGAIELGQGVHIKLIQTASKELGIPPEQIYTAETSTDTVPNVSPTAGSASADLNGMAVLRACKTLMKRLAPYQEKDPDGGWCSWVNTAHHDQVQLSATGFYKDENVIDFDFKKGVGSPVAYFAFGVAVTEVEVDILTGDHRVLRVDIVVDAGNSLNPAVDISQVEGGYVQGYGLLTLEELVYSPQGELRTKGPYTYKIPTVNDIPREFNVSLLRDSPNQRAIYSSKGVGEPPFALGISAFSAIKMAIRAARNDNSPFRLDSPATSERIRMACTDDLIKKAKPPAKAKYEEWYVVV